MDKKYLVVAGLVLILILGVIFPRPVEKTVERIIEKIGAFPGPTLDANELTIGGVEKFYKQFTSASSSVVCSQTNPYSAVAGHGTTTIDRITYYLKGGHSAAFTFSISTSTTAYGSSSPALIPNTNVASGANLAGSWTPRHGTTTVFNETLFWDSDDLTNPSEKGNSPFILGGGQEINLRIATSTPGSEKVTGACSFELTKIAN